MKADHANLEWLGDPEVFSVNRLDARSDHRYYPDQESALRGVEMIWRQSLNGDWKFKFSKDKESRPVDFYQPDFDSSRWETIPVPGHVQFYGYDQINYANKQYQWDGVDAILPPELPTYNPAFSYLKTFTVDEALKGMRKELVFNGVETAFYVWLNGVFVGYDEDSFTPTRFDVTDLINEEGENVLAVEVWKASTASWIHDQDMFRFNGIFRDVDLFGIPALHVDDLEIRTELSDEFTQARVDFTLKLNNEKPHTVNVQILDAEGKEAAASTIHEQAQSKDTFSLSLDNIHLWSAEDPYLYQVVLSLYNENNELIEVIPYKLGLRDFRMVDGVMMLNGKRIVFRGINRHEFRHDSGHVLDEETMVWDIKFMKSHNLNAVRTSHYPNQTRWYELCDEYGLYVIDEGNLEAHGLWEIVNKIPYEKMVPGDNPKWTATLVDRVTSMAERDKNHPSILIWSPGNESWTGTNLNAMTKYLMDRKDGRLVQYEGCYWNPDKQWEVETEIETRMYPPAAVIEEYLQSNPKKPYINLEYAHGMGNSLGGLCKYIELEEKYDQYQGGFIWDYADQAVEHIDQCGKKALGYGGDFRDRHADYNFSGNGVLFADRTLSPKVQEMKYQYQDVKLYPNEEGVKIFNKALFTNTNAYDLKYVLSKEGEVLEEGILCADVQPGQTKQIDFDWNLDAYRKEGKLDGELVQTVSLLLKEDRKYAPKGHETAFGQNVLGLYENPAKAEGAIKMVAGDKDTGFYGDGFEMKFEEGLGMVSLRVDGHEYLAASGKPSFFRAPTDNEAGYKHDYTSAPWAAATMFEKVDSMKAYLSEDKKTGYVEYVYNLPGLASYANPAQAKVTYTISAPGIVKVDANWKGMEGLPEMPMFGMDFRFYNDLDHFSYYGKGPDENYIDRKDGAKMGVHSTTVKKNMTPYLLPQECGNRTDIRWIDLLDKDENGLRFTMTDAPLQASILPYDPFMITSALHQEELPDSYYTFASIRGFNMGVGGDDSWGLPVLPEYCVPSNVDRRFSFTITPIRAAKA